MDTATEKELRTFVTEGIDDVKTVAFSLDGNTIAFGGFQGNLYFYRRDFRLEQGSPFYPQLKKEAHKLFKDKELYHILTNNSTETTEEPLSF